MWNSLYADAKPYSASRVGISVYSKRTEKALVVGTFKSVTVRELLFACAALGLVINIDESGLVLDDILEE